MSNATILTADRATHIKIVAVSLVASIAVLLAGIAARTTTSADHTFHIQAAGPAVKAGKPVAISRNETAAIR
jgi:hypothetical protein